MIAFGLVVMFSISYVFQQFLTTTPALESMAEAIDQIYGGLGQVIRFAIILLGALIPMLLYFAGSIWWIGFAERRGRI